MIERSQVTGLVLAGGLGRRMAPGEGGVDKGLEPFRGRPMIAHVIERFAPQVGALLVNANRNRERYVEFGYPVVGDEIPDFAGPLAGLHAGLRACATRWLATAPCDSPFLPADLVARLAEGAVAAGAPLAVARTASGSQPVFLLVAHELLPHLEGFLAGGRRRVDAWYASLAVVEVDFDDEQAFLNINTREELARSEPEAR
jgi:molybdenum cofactor guanylyltransferase